MDQITQHNAALVEEMAAAASSLQNQAQDLVHTVAVFQLDQGTGMADDTSGPAPCMVAARQHRTCAPCAPESAPTGGVKPEHSATKLQQEERLGKLLSPIKYSQNGLWRLPIKR